MFKGQNLNETILQIGDMLAFTVDAQSQDWEVECADVD